MKIAFDVEGPIASPAFDFSWLCLEQTSGEFYERIKRFDEYDDLRWAYERETGGQSKHSTGTTPLISLLAAACEGFTDLRLTQMAGEKLRLSRGVGGLLKWLISEKGMIPHFITSSYPAVPLLIAKQFVIPSSHVYCAGNQLSGEQLSIFDSNPSFDLQIASRSPVELWSRHREGARKFLNGYLENCIEMRSAYVENRDKKDLLEGQQKIFSEIKDSQLRDSLTRLILKQHGVMGGHNKRKALSKVSPDPELAIFIGDGIVDADALDYAKYGIAINCTSSYALHSCKLNIATSNEALLIPVLEQIMEGKFEVEKAKRECTGDEFIIFSHRDIKAKFDEVKRINSTFREAMKQHF